MSKVPPEIIDDIRRKIDIVQVTRRYVELKRAGIGSWKGLCPFHQEKTPSFHVNEQGFFRCFGCDAKGDVFSFLQQIEHFTFGEAMRELAREAGIDLPEREMSPAEKRAAEQAEGERSRMLRITDMAVAFYQQVLDSDRGQGARAYLERRGLTPETVQKFRLGYAPPDGEALHRHLAALKMSFADVERLGLARRNERGRYDFFRDRVMFPVFDRQKRAVGFSGRVLDPDAKTAKYVNTPDSPVFHKKDLLYGLHLAQPAIRKSERAVVVEGQADVIALHQAGIEEVVAPMGTALTAEHVALLGRLARYVIVVFDGDEAGQRAARRALPLFVDPQVEGRVVRLPRGVDPDDFIKTEGNASFTALLAVATPMMEKFIDDLAGEAEKSIPGRVEAVGQAAPLLAKVRNQTERELYVGRLAAALGLRIDQVWRDVRAAHAVALRGHAGDRRAVPSQPVRSADEQNAPPDAPPRPAPPPIELDAIGLLVSNADTVAGQPDARDVIDLLVDPDMRRLYRAAHEALVAGQRLDVPAWIDAAPPELREPVWRTVMDERWKNLRAPDRAMRDIAIKLRVMRIDAELAMVDSQLRSAITRGDVQAVRALTQRSVELKRRRQELLSGKN